MIVVKYKRMDVGKLITDLILILVGAAVFIIGMNMMSSGLKKATGRGLRRLLKELETIDLLV